MNEPRISPLLEALTTRLNEQEDLELEFKAAKGGLPDNLWPTVSAFANTHGGWLVLGVAEEEGQFAATGIGSPHTLLQNFHNLLRNPQKINYPVCGADDTTIEVVAGKQVIVIRVQEAARRARPIYINGNPYGGTYVRRNSGDYRCTKPEVDRMMREASDTSADSTVLERYTLDDLDRDALARYRRRFQTQDPASPWNSYDDLRFLRASGGYGRHRDTGVEGITVAGLLMFGDLEAIRDWRTRHLIDYRAIPGESTIETRWDDRVAWEGNLFGAFETLYPRLIAGLPVPFTLRDGIRVDESAVHVALREALVNLLVHSDYAETQASLILRSPEGYFFRNPGSSRISEHDLLTGDRSDPRNPVLVRMFRLAGFADEAGTGMPKIIGAWRSMGLQLPRIDVGSERYEFALSLRHAHLLSENDRTWLGSLGDQWSEAEQLALIFARHEGEIDNFKLRGLTGLHPADATKVLSGLRGRDLLVLTGGGRRARYHLGPATTAANSYARVGVHPGSSLLNSPTLPLDSPTSDANSPTLPLDSPTSTPPIGATTADIAHIWPELQALARPFSEHHKLSTARRDELLVQLCARYPLSSRELAELTGRTQPYMVERLKALVSAGQLYLIYPNHPNHPRQRYTIAATSSEQPTEQTHHE